MMADYIFLKFTTCQECVKNFKNISFHPHVTRTIFPVSLMGKIKLRAV